MRANVRTRGGFRQEGGDSSSGPWGRVPSTRPVVNGSAPWLRNACPPSQRAGPRAWTQRVRPRRRPVLRFVAHVRPRTSCVRARTRRVLGLGPRVRLRTSRVHRRTRRVRGLAPRVRARTRHVLGLGPHVRAQTSGVHRGRDTSTRGQRLHHSNALKGRADVWRLVIYHAPRRHDCRCGREFCQYLRCWADATSHKRRSDRRRNSNDRGAAYGGYEVVRGNRPSKWTEARVPGR